MRVVEWLCLGLAALSFLYWAAVAVFTWLSARRLPVLREIEPPKPLRWPRLSVVIPACNEGATIEAALRAKLSDTYPDLEIIVVDDRSTDDTGAIADRIAAEDPRVRVVHISSLPEGWLGKVHALHRGSLLASGEYLLFSDADIHWEPGTLARVMASCEARSLDLVAVFPEIWPSGLIVDAATSAFTRMTVFAARMWAVSDPRSSASMGIGAFNLVRRATFEGAGGFAWIKLDAADDAALGQMMKRAGGRCEVMIGRGQVSLHFYRSVAEFARSAEKGAVMLGFSAARGVTVGTILFTLECAPFVLVFASSAAARGLAALALTLALANSLAIARLMGQRAAPALLVPLGSALMSWAMARAGVLGARRGGLSWRGTFYPKETLLEGRRFDVG